MRGWLTFPLARGFRIGVSPTRSWISLPLFRGLRGGLSVPIRQPRRRQASPPPSTVVPPALPGRMPASYVDD
jgi:hypothetical protein